MVKWVEDTLLRIMGREEIPDQVYEDYTRLKLGMDRANLRIDGTLLALLCLRYISLPESTTEELRKRRAVLEAKRDQDDLPPLPYPPGERVTFIYMGMEKEGKFLDVNYDGKYEIEGEGRIFHINPQHVELAEEDAVS